MLITITKWQVWENESGSQWLVARCNEEPEKLLHYGGPSYMTEVPSLHLIAEWEPMSSSKAELKYLTEFRSIKPSKPDTVSGGWLAPDGKWYPCHYAQHDAMARRIVATLYNKLGDAAILEEKGYIRIHDDGMVITFEKGTYFRTG
jgi:hypothetical protein